MAQFLSNKAKGYDWESYYSLGSTLDGGLGLYEPSKESKWTRIGLNLESFKRAPNTTGGQHVYGRENVDDLEKLLADAPMLQQIMKPRHLTMIAVAGSIGTGLFVGSGAALADGGPAALIIAYIILGIMLINVTQAIGEMSILFPVSGGFYTLAGRFLDPSYAFAMGWNYVFSWAVTLPLEVVVASSLISHWTDAVHPGVWITIFWLAVVLISLFGTLGFAEEEFWSACFKLLVILIFLFVGVICIGGGGPPSGLYSQPIGSKLWDEAGLFPNGFSGFCSVFVTAAFSFAGTELIGLAASETPNPRQAMPGAVKGTFWRVYLVYVASVGVIGTLVSYKDERLTKSVSPFFIVLEDAKIPFLPDLMIATILASVISLAACSVYAASRTLTALAETGYAPKIFAYVDKSSRPLFSLLVVLCMAPLSYLSLSPSIGMEVFRWLLATSALSTLFTWASICLCHIRFRKAWKVQGHSIRELPFRALGGTVGSWFGVVLVVLVFFGQLYISIFPAGGRHTEPGEAVKQFFSKFLAVPVMCIFWVTGYLWKRERPKKAHEIDIDGGRKCWLTAEQMDEYRAERKRAPWHIRIYRFLFSY